MLIRGASSTLVVPLLPPGLSSPVLSLSPSCHLHSPAHCNPLLHQLLSESPAFIPPPWNMAAVSGEIDTTAYLYCCSLSGALCHPRVTRKLSHDHSNSDLYGASSRWHLDSSIMHWKLEISQGPARELFQLYFSMCCNLDFMQHRQYMAHIMNDAGLKLFGLILWGIYVISKCSRDSWRKQMNFTVKSIWMWTRWREFMLQKAIWNLCLKICSHMRHLFDKTRIWNA